MPAHLGTCTECRSPLSTAKPASTCSGRCRTRRHRRLLLAQRERLAMRAALADELVAALAAA